MWSTVASVPGALRENMVIVPCLTNSALKSVPVSVPVLFQVCLKPFHTGWALGGPSRPFSTCRKIGPEKVLILSFWSQPSKQEEAREACGWGLKERNDPSDVSEDRLECGQRFQDSP